MSLLVRLLSERIMELKDHILWCATQNHYIHHRQYPGDWPMQSCVRAQEILSKDEDITGW
jgi:hypothetical protein